MASRKNLKRDIRLLTGYLVDDALALYTVANEDMLEPIEALLSRILNMETESLCRAARPDGKDNPTLVKAHYNRLKEFITQEVNAIEEELNKLIEQHNRQ